MPSIKIISSAAAAVLTFSSTVAAIPQKGYNSTVAAPYGNSTTPITSEAMFCPALNGEVYTDMSGSSFFVECGTSHFGTIIAGPAGMNATMPKRAVGPPSSPPASLADCLDLCDLEADCVGAAYDTSAKTCALYAEVGAAYAAANIDFALRVSSGPGVAVPAGGKATSTLYSTTVKTISSCAPTVTNCPLNAVYTEIYAVTSTAYVCPTATVVPAAPVACSSCAWSAKPVTAWTASGSTVVACPTSTVVAVPCPTGTAVSTTACHACTATVGAYGTGSYGTAAPSASATYKTTPFTGGAESLKAGMGMAAVMVGAALVL